MTDHLTIREAATEIGISNTKLYQQAVYEKKIPYKNPKRKMWFHINDIKKFKEEHGYE